MMVASSISTSFDPFGSPPPPPPSPPPPPGLPCGGLVGEAGEVSPVIAWYGPGPREEALGPRPSGGVLSVLPVWSVIALRPRSGVDWFIGPYELSDWDDTLCWCID